MGHRFKINEPLHETAAVLSYEAGKLLETAMYLYWGKDSSDTKAKLALTGLAKSQLMDIGAQFQLLCESLSVDPQQMIELGIEKAEERFSKKEWKHFDLREPEET